MATAPSDQRPGGDELSSESPNTPGVKSAASSAPPETPESWAMPVFEAVRDRTGSGSRRIVVVPDAASLYSLQRACVSKTKAGHLLTARYVVPGPAGLGTMFAALVADVERLT